MDKPAKREKLHLGLSPNRMYSDPRSTQFFHGTNAALNVGDHVVPAAELNPNNPSAVQSNPMMDGQSDSRTVNFTSSAARGRKSGIGITFLKHGGMGPGTYVRPDAEGAAQAAQRWGKHVYPVSPLGVHHEDFGITSPYDRQGEPGVHLKVTGPPLQPHQFGPERDPYADINYDWRHQS